MRTRSTAVVQTAFDRVVNALCRRNGYPACVAAVALEDGPTLTTSAEDSTPNRVQSINDEVKMLAGSVGKTFVAATLLQLVEMGQLGLTDPISRWFGSAPWFEKLPNHKDVTIHMLLNHSSGLPNHVSVPEFVDAVLQSPDKMWTPEERIHFVLDKHALFPAGRGYAYSDTNYILVGMVIEQITGRSFYDVAQETLLGPQQLNSIVPSDKRVIDGLAGGYIHRENPMKLRAQPVLVEGRLIMNPQFEWTGGGFASSPRDLAVWANRLYGGKILEPKTLQTMLSMTSCTEYGSSYGLGVVIRKSVFKIAYGHTGYMPGYLTHMWYFPRRGMAVAAMVNTDHPWIKSDEVDEIATAVEVSLRAVD
jgi:D-alanyl-D-alanine carboxypeptidase